jgi:hypothetical protein
MSAAPKFTACCAEPHCRSPRLEPRVARDVERLLAVLLHAACEDVLDELRLDPRALDDLGVDEAEERGGVDVLEDAFLGVSAPDWRPHRLDDDDLTRLHRPTISTGRLVN